MRSNNKHCKWRFKQLFGQKVFKLNLIIKISIAIVIGIIASVLLWYNIQLSPVNKTATPLVKIVIKSGSSPTAIAKDLESNCLIRNSTAFQIYLRLTGKINMLKAGTYNLSSMENVGQIVERLVNGAVETFDITFYPGATLKDPTDKPESKKQDVTTVLRRAGYSDSDITAALTANYDSPIFAGKPTEADLEGYIYGETYKFNEGTSVKEILQRAFDEFYSQVQKNNLVAKFASHGLNLYEGITLASIVQKEVSGDSDQKQVAGVFYNRLSIGMSLGSDVTYQYAADQLGVMRDPNLDSPYNTRRFGGLPPGPISSPGLSALIAAAEPASNDYLFFLSGDDGVTYFATNEYGHQANIASHCLVKCSIP